MQPFLMDLYEHLVQLDTTDSIQSKDSIIDIGDDHASGRGDRKITIVHLSQCAKEMCNSHQ